MHDLLNDYMVYTDGKLWPAMVLMLDEFIEELKGAGATEKDISILLDYGWRRNDD